MKLRSSAKSRYHVYFVMAARCLCLCILVTITMQLQLPLTNQNVSDASEVIEKPKTAREAHNLHGVILSSAPMRTTALPPVRPTPAVTRDVDKEDGDVACPQTVRLDHLNKSCSNSRALTDLSGPLMKVLSPNILVCDRFKLLVCINWKTGSSTLRDVLLNNSDFLSWTEVEKFSYDLQPLSSYPMSGQVYRLKHYFNMMMVRHPLDRLVSAYNDKLNVDRVYRKHLGPKIIDRYNLNVTADEYEEGRGVSFAMFLEYIKDGGRDGHWEEFHRNCKPCVVHYHFIMRTETLAPDLRYIIDAKLAGKGHLAKKRNWRPTGRDIKASRQLTEYGAVSDSLLNHIVNRYRTDMEMFGYSFRKDKGSVQTNCEINMDGTQCC